MRRYFFCIVVLFSILLFTRMADGAPSLPLAGPRLEATPDAAAPTGLPALATWPVWRYTHPPRVLAITGKLGSAAPYARICRRLRARLELRYISTGDDRYHVNDKWIEPTDTPTQDELKSATIATAIAAVNPVGEAPYDVIFCDNPDNLLLNTELQTQLLRYMTNGGTFVMCGSLYPANTTPLGKVWPATPGNNLWQNQGGQRTDGPELAGIPLERLAGWTWTPTPLVAEGAVALATGQNGAAYLRAVGAGRLLYVPTGPLSRHYHAITNFGRNYDHDEIWLRFWDQLLYTLLNGERAIPVYADLRSGEKPAAPGENYKLAGSVANRAWPGVLTAVVHVCAPNGAVVYTHQDTLTVPRKNSVGYDVQIPIGTSWGAGLYSVYLTVGDATRKVQFQQALAYLPVAGPVTLTLASAKKGYRLGEEASFTLTTLAPTPWTGTLRFGVYDYRGRLLASSAQPATLTNQSTTQTFTYQLVDHGVNVDSLWAEVTAVKEGVEYGRAEVKFYKYEPWSTRNEYQWSTWAGIAAASPCLVPAGMRLMAHAGMNALGYPGRPELSYAAERWGWRYYNENIGMNTFAPVIEYENDQEIEKALLIEATNAANEPDLVSAAYVLGSVGEEAGFKNGWGTRYYWDTPVAPEKAGKALQWYLKTKYPTLEALNATWHTRYAAWDDVKLTKEFSGTMPTLAADGWAHPKESPLGAGVTDVTLAPFADTADFYNWYYDRIITVARRILRERINPVTRTMSSAPTIGSANYDVRLTGPNGWYESQLYSTIDGPEPGFGLIWGHFDWSVMTENMFWGFLLERSGHNNYWVDIPLMFNNDLSHTRASFAMRRWTTHLAGHERIILDSIPVRADIGVLSNNGLTADAISPGNMTTSLRVALNQGGFQSTSADISELQPYKVLFAIGRQSVSRQDADRLDRYVADGGTLVFTPRFACQDEVGMPCAVSPGGGLADKWQFRIMERTEAVPMYHDTSPLSFALDGVDPTLHGARVSGQKIYREKVFQQGWTSLATYEDGTPALLSRTYGKGRLLYLNALYQSHWYIQWITPTDADRQGFFQLITWCCQQFGAQRTLRLNGPLDEVLHMAVKQFTDPSGNIHYAIVRTNGEVPWTNGTLNWLGPETACYDILGTEDGAPASLLGTAVAMNLRPGAGKLLAFVRAPVQTIRVHAQSAVLDPGHPLHLTVQILGADGRPVPGCFPLELRATGPGGEMPGLRRSFSLQSGDAYTLNTALDDPAGVWTLSVTDGISGCIGTTEVRAVPTLRTAGPGFKRWPLASENWEPTAMTAEEFLTRLQRLTDIYRSPHPVDGWMTKQALGYYYDFFPGTRHDVLRPLNDADWRPFIPALRAAVRAGGTFILTGEDVGIDPATGLGTWASQDGRQLSALASALAGASWSRVTPDGDTLRASLGNGQIVLCRESIDAAGNTNPQAAQWQQRWLAELTKGQHGPTIPPMDLGMLERWWIGRAAAGDSPRIVSWLAGNQRQTTIAVDPASRLTSVCTLVSPPTGAVRDLTFAISLGDTPVTVDVGCDGNADAILFPAADATVRQATLAALTAAVNHYLTWADAHHVLYRDDNRWRLIPLRFSAPKKTTVTISAVQMTVR